MSQQEANEIAREAQRRWRGRRMLQIALPTAAALGAGAAIAVGSIPGGDGTITGCYASPNPVTNEDHTPKNITINGVTEAPGSLRVIDPSLPKTFSNPLGAQGTPNPAAQCEPEEKQVTWNQSGPAGPQGPSGPQGPAGGQGAGGTPGSPGAPLIGDTSFGLSNNGGTTFLKLDGIKGESTDKHHPGEIEIDSFSFGAHNTGAQASGGGGGAGKTIESFTITKTLDKSSPLLFQAAATGKHIAKAELSFVRKAGKGQQDYLKIDLTNVLISSVQDGQASNKATPLEQVTFNFAKATETVITGGGRPSSVSFNLNAQAKV